MFAFSLLLALTLIFLNVTLMTSVHGFGSNNVPPEIAKVRSVYVLPMSARMRLHVVPLRAHDATYA